MALVDYDDELDAEDGSSLVKKLRAKIEEQSKALKELETENAKYQTITRKRELGEMLEKRGYAPKIAAFIPSDLELSDESVDSWLSEYGDAFSPVTAQPAADEAPRTVVVNNAAEAESLRRMQAAEGGSAPAVSSADVLQRINNASNMDELVAALRGGS